MLYENKPELILTIPVKLTNFGTASPLPAFNKEDEKAADLARRAQHGDYNEGKSQYNF